MNVTQPSIIVLYCKPVQILLEVLYALVSPVIWTHCCHHYSVKVSLIHLHIKYISTILHYDQLIFSLDINECDEGSDGCHQICTNTNGSFECSCLPEFELLSDQRACDGGNIKVYR